MVLSVLPSSVTHSYKESWEGMQGGGGGIMGTFRFGLQTSKNLFYFK